MSSDPAQPRIPAYDVALSFAGEERDHASALALALQARDVKVFIDEFEKSQLWGKNLYDFLTGIYSSGAQLCVMFLSEAYSKKAWTTLERQSAQARALQEDRDYILPLRMDDTPIPGILETLGYIDLRQTSIEEVADLVVQKLKNLQGKEDGNETQSSRAYYESLGARIPVGATRLKLGAIEIEFTFIVGNVIDVTRLAGDQEIWLSERGIEAILRLEDTLLQARRGHYVAAMRIAGGQSLPEFAVAAINYTTRRLTLEAYAIRYLAAASISGVKKAAKTLQTSGKTSVLKAIGVALACLVLGVFLSFSTTVTTTLFWISFVCALVYPHLM